MRTTAALAVAACALSAACASSGGAHDTVPMSTDVRTSEEVRASSRESYSYVATRPYVVVALAEARGLDEGAAQRMVDELASRVAACFRTLATRGELAEGAARLVLVAGAAGGVAGLRVRLAPGDDVTRNALLCVAPAVKLVPLPPAPQGAKRGMAIELTWGPTIAPSAAPASPGEAPSADAAGTTPPQ